MVRLSDLNIGTTCCRFKGRAASFVGRYEPEPIIAPEVLMTKDVQQCDNWDRLERERDIRQGIDLATTLERIEKNFVITDPRLPDNPIVRFEFQKVNFGCCYLFHAIWLAIQKARFSFIQVNIFFLFLF